MHPTTQEKMPIHHKVHSTAQVKMQIYHKVRSTAQVKMQIHQLLVSGNSELNLKCCIE